MLTKMLLTQALPQFRTHHDLPGSYKELIANEFMEKFLLAGQLR